MYWNSSFLGGIYFILFYFFLLQLIFNITLVSGVQHSGQTIIYSIKCSPLIFPVPMWHHTQLFPYYQLYSPCCTLYPHDYFVTTNLYFSIPSSFVVLYSRGLQSLVLIHGKIQDGQGVYLLSSGKTHIVVMEVGKKNLQMMDRYPSLLTLCKVRYAPRLGNL